MPDVNPPAGDTDAPGPADVPAVTEPDETFVDDAPPTPTENNPAPVDGPQDLDQTPGSAYDESGQWVRP